jgi:hypothetical protein
MEYNKYRIPKIHAGIGMGMKKRYKPISGYNNIAE